MKKPLEIDFGQDKLPGKEFAAFERIIIDRKSVYSVSVGKVLNREGLKEFLKRTKKLKNHHKATHHSWAVRISKDGAIYESKSDDSETGAGNVILRMIKKHRFVNTAVCVTRWYGGEKLYADRFKHVQDAAIFGLESI